MRKALCIARIMVLILPLIMVSSCSNKGAEVREIKVAIVEPLTGLAADIGIRAANGVELAIEEINSNGGIKSLGGAKLVPVRYDTQSKPDVGISQAEAAAREGCVAIIGCAQSAVSMVVTQVAEKNRIPCLVTVGQLDQITDRGFKFTFSITPTTTQINNSLLRFLETLKSADGGPLKVAHLYEDTSYGQGAQSWLQAHASEFNIKFLGGTAYPANSTDMTSVVAKVKSQNPDFVMISSYLQDAILIMRTARDLRLNVSGLQNSSGDNDGFITSLGPVAEYVFFNAYWAPNVRLEGAAPDRGAKLNQAYQDKFGESMSAFSMLGHTAAYVLADALERAGSTDHEKVRQALVDTDLTPASGIIMPVLHLKFDQKGRNSEAGVLVGQILNGKREIVYPVQFRTADPVFPMPRWEDRGM